eukprot:CAMPEP_0182475750 /NCGR_PEP_ID=MMETSP1319-20130603/27896_1 /TAXON_ID=172717 /ORGANISM="Bolidomonas pacifica, Strain RCC208" /LENGTH=287 /DNA_ID=CAMNT_0024676773 /DNA_START=90 /DNA_END=950 /DNA_ORIENTATION=-
MDNFNDQNSQNSQNSDGSDTDSSDDDGEPLFRYSRLRSPILPREDEGTPAQQLVGHPPSSATTSSIVHALFTVHSTLLLSTSSPPSVLHLHPSGSAIFTLPLPSPITSLSCSSSAFLVTTSDTAYLYALPCLGGGGQPDMLEEIKYEAKQNVPITCSALPDSTNNSTSLILGSHPGVLTLTRKTWLGRRDVTLHHCPTPLTSLSITSTHLAFADHLTVKVLDLSKFQPVLSLDRPSGARPNLRPGAPPPLPTMLFTGPSSPHFPATKLTTSQPPNWPPSSSSSSSSS